MTATRFVLAAILAATLLALPGFAIKDRCDSELADSLIYESGPTRNQLNGLANSKGEMIQAIQEARQKFWETYPDKDKATAKKARHDFANLLLLKDIYFLELALRWPQSRDVTERRGPGFATKVQDFLNGLLPTDGGIRQAASPEFFEWVEAVRKGFGPEPRNFDDIFKQSFNVALMGDTFWKAVAGSQKQYLTYVTERDWWEFDAVNRIPPRFDTPKYYAIYLYARYNKLPMDDACSNYFDMLDALRNDTVVFQSADRVRRAPKTPGGLLIVTAAPPMKTTPSGQQVEDPTVPMPEGVIGVYSDPVRAMEILATQDDDRRYLHWLLTRQNMPDGRYFYVAGKWSFAIKTYHQFALAFEGEQDMLSAARLVRTARKRMTSDTVMNQQAIGATRNEPFEAFEDILARKNPRGYVRIALALNQDLHSPPAIDAAYAKFVSSHDEKAVLEAARRAAAGKPYLTNKREIETLEREVGSPTAEPPEQRSSEAESPFYLQWKGFPAGAKATYIWRGLQPPKPGANDFVPGRTEVRSTYSVQTINSEHADVWFSEIVYDYPSGAAHPPHETEYDYPAKDRRLSASQRPAPAPVKSGDQVLTIGGKSLHTHWESVRPNPTGCPDFVVTTWTSPEVPGELVRKLEDINCNGNRRVSETLLESFQGSRSQAALTEAGKRSAAAPANNANGRSAPTPTTPARPKK